MFNERMFLARARAKVQSQTHAVPLSHLSLARASKAILVHSARVHIVRISILRTVDFKNNILKMFGSRELYGYEIHKMLAIEGSDVEISRLYRILNEMSKEGLLEGRWAKSQLGPERRLYTIGTNGRNELNKILLDAISTVHSFYGRYLVNLAPKFNMIESIIIPLTGGLKGNENIAFIAPRCSPMYDVILSYLKREVPQGKIFFVEPKSVKSDLRRDDILLVDGSYVDIPLKDDYVSLVFVIDLPNQDVLEKALKEWSRVINQNGTIAILTPSILVSKYEEPMSIGDFVEKYEPEAIEKGLHADKEHLKALLNRFFNVVHEMELVHMTTFTASQKKVGN
jgi:DNA-binding PadR family transcriptional regulator